MAIGEGGTTAGGRAPQTHLPRQGAALVGGPVLPQATAPRQPLVARRHPRRWRCRGPRGWRRGARRQAGGRRRPARRLPSRQPPHGGEPPAAASRSGGRRPHRPRRCRRHPPRRRPHQHTPPTRPAGGVAAASRQTWGRGGRPAAPPARRGRANGATAVVARPHPPPRPQREQQRQTPRQQPRGKGGGGCRPGGGGVAPHRGQGIRRHSRRRCRAERGVVRPPSPPADRAAVDQGSRGDRRQSRVASANRCRGNKGDGVWVTGASVAGGFSHGGWPDPD